MTKYVFTTITSVFQIFFIVVLLFVLSMIAGHFIAYFSVGKIDLFKYIILGSSLLVIVLSFLLIYTEIVPIIVLVTVLASIRWAKFVFQSYPFIESVKATVDFGTSLFLTVCSIILWFVFELFNIEYFSFEKLIEFFFSTILLPLMIIYTICFNVKNEIKDKGDGIANENIGACKNEGIQNYYINFSSKIYNKFIMKFKKKTKNN